MATTGITSTGHGEPHTDLHKELPTIVEYLQRGWLASFQGAAVVSTLSAGVAAQLFAFIKDPSNYPVRTDPSSLKALYVLSYSGIVFGCGATLSSLLLTKIIGDSPVYAASERSDLPAEGKWYGQTKSLLAEYTGRPRLFKALIWHWFTCLQAGIWCIVIQIVLYVWLQETWPVKGLVLGFVLYAMCPLLALFTFL